MAHDPVSRHVEPCLSKSCCESLSSPLHEPSPAVSEPPWLPRLTGDRSCAVEVGHLSWPEQPNRGLWTFLHHIQTGTRTVVILDAASKTYLCLARANGNSIQLTQSPRSSEHRPTELITRRMPVEINKRKQQAHPA